MPSIGGNAPALRSDWASAASSAVMTRAGRCCKEQIRGGAILLTRSLLRQAGGNAARRRVISSKGLPVPGCQGSTCHFFFAIEHGGEGKSCSLLRGQEKVEDRVFLI